MYSTKHAKTWVKLLITFLQGSVVTQTVLGGLAVYPPVANFLPKIMKIG